MQKSTTFGVTAPSHPQQVMPQNMGSNPGRVVPGALNLYLIDEKELPQLRMNGCDKVLLTDLGGLENQVLGAPEFGIFPLAMNYKYRPSDEAVLSKFPNLRFLPSEQEAKGLV